MRQSRTARGGSHIGFGGGANVSGKGREVGGNNLFQDSGDGLKENNNAEYGRRVMGGLARLVMDHPICHFH